MPDACVDGFRLVWHNAVSARRYGGTLLTYHEVTGIEQSNGRVSAVLARNCHTGENLRFECDYIVNAAGSWSGQIAQLAGLDVQVPPQSRLLPFTIVSFTRGQPPA